MHTLQITNYKLQIISSKHMNQPVNNYEVKNNKQYSDVEKEEICMKM